jgi:hypothetical protein
VGFAKKKFDNSNSPTTGSLTVFYLSCLTEPHLPSFIDLASTLIMLATAILADNALLVDDDDCSLRLDVSKFFDNILALLH